MQYIEQKMMRSFSDFSFFYLLSCFPTLKSFQAVHMHGLSIVSSFHLSPVLSYHPSAFSKSYPAILSPVSCPLFSSFILSLCPILPSFHHVSLTYTAIISPFSQSYPAILSPVSCPILSSFSFL